MTQPSGRQFVTFHPPGDLQLRMLSNGREYDATITMTNTFTDQVAFKFRADSYKDISVTPSKGILEPNQEKTVALAYSSREVRPPETLQVLVTPVDEQCSLDHKIQDLFSRAQRKDIQEYMYPIRIPSPKDTITEAQTEYQERKQPRPLKDRRNVTAPLPVIVPASVIAGTRAASYPQNVQNMSSSALLEESIVEAYPNEPLDDSVFLHPDEEIPYAWKTQPGYRLEDGRLPHYDLHLSSRGSELDSSNMSLRRRLKGNFSQIGIMLKDLTDQSKNLRENQRWCFIIFWILIVLFLLVSVLLVLPKFRRRYRHEHVHGDINLVQAAVEEVTETYIENRKGPTLDQLIHARMS